MNSWTCDSLVRVAPADCEGCGRCCRGMGDTIHIDPWDTMMLTTHLGMSFMDLLDEKFDLRVEDGLLLPNLALDDQHPNCPFLDREGRCRIHDFRPGICRLFPLGREYTGKTFHYILSPGECPNKKYKVKISKYLDIPDLRQYEAFVGEWHAFVKAQQAVMGRVRDIKEKQVRNKELLHIFYITPYTEEGFYDEFYSRLRNILVMQGENISGK
ncbi:MAG: YkgJ family cysteine cluster protein [Lachnospiraceae bacterium]|nr:YkgJ family cysteine cluster protein [Lachnospiraceae bacterium]